MAAISRPESVLVAATPMSRTAILDRVKHTQSGNGVRWGPLGGCQAAVRLGGRRGSRARRAARRARLSDCSALEALECREGLDTTVGRVARSGDRCTTQRCGCRTSRRKRCASCTSSDALPEQPSGAGHLRDESAHEGLGLVTLGAGAEDLSTPRSVLSTTRKQGATASRRSCAGLPVDPRLDRRASSNRSSKKDSDPLELCRRTNTGIFSESSILGHPHCSFAQSWSELQTGTSHTVGQLLSVNCRNLR